MAIEDEANRDRARMIQVPILGYYHQQTAEMEKRNGPKKKKKRDPRAPRAAAVPYTFFLWISLVLVIFVVKSFVLNSKHRIETHPLEKVVCWSVV